MFDAAGYTFSGTNADLASEATTICEARVAMSQSSVLNAIEQRNPGDPKRAVERLVITAEHDVCPAQVAKLSTPSPSPSPTATKKHHHLRHRHSHVPVPRAGPSSNAPGSSDAWCTASAVYNAQYNDYDIYVHSNQPNQSVTASASNGESQSYYTNSSGYADVYLYADPGNTVTVTVGPASCSTTA
jgi:hypothetical protein